MIDSSKPATVSQPTGWVLSVGDSSPIRNGRSAAGLFSQGAAGSRGSTRAARRVAASISLPPIAYRPGWDHAVLAELALYGEIRHVAEMSFWRRHGGKPVDQLARGCSQFTQRDLPHDDDIADLYWSVPLISTAFAHIERFALARVAPASRCEMMAAVAPIFRARWLAAMRREAAIFKELAAARTERLATAEPTARLWGARQISGVLDAIQMIVPEEDVSSERLALYALIDDAQTTADYSS